MATKAYDYHVVDISMRLEEARGALRNAELALFRTAELNPNPAEQQVADARAEAERLSDLVTKLETSASATDNTG